MRSRRDAARSAARFTRPRPLRSVLAGLGASALAAFAAACGGDSGPTSDLVVRDSAGIAIAEASGPGWSEEAGWRLELELDVGAIEGEDAFARLVDVAPRRAGGLWLTDSQSRRVRGYDENGMHVLAFGRPGEGPGEFRSIGRVHETADGELWIGGRLPLELYRFGPGGTPLGVERIPPEAIRSVAASEEAEARPPLGPTIGSWGFAGSDRFVVTMTLDASEGGIQRTDVLLRATDSGAPVRLADWTSSALEGGPGGRLQLFAPTPSWAPLSDGGAWVTTGDSYELRQIAADGSLARIVRRPGPRAALTPEVREAFVAGLRKAADNPSALAMLERAEFPDSLPATVALWSSPDGHLWVGVPDPARPLRRDQPNALDVFAPGGQLLGRVAIPDRLRPTRITDDHLYGIWLDELDVPHARRYRIERDE